MVRLYQKAVFFCFSLVLLGCSGGELSSADLFEASFKGDTKHVAYLIKKGVDVNAVEEDGWTSLMAASWKGHVEVVKALLSAGANVNAADKDGWTASMIAQGRENSEIVHLLRSRRR